MKVRKVHFRGGMKALFILNESATDNASSTEETSAMAMELDRAVRDSGKIVQEVRLHTNALVENASQFKL